MSNTLLPTVELQGRLTPFHVIRTSSVKVDISETFEIKERGQTLYGLAKPALAKIASAAGISWDAENSGVVGQPTPDYLMYRAVARMNLPDGTPAVGMGTTEWFASEELAPIKERMEEAKAAGDNKKYYGLKKALSDAVKYRVPNAESKAMNRAIRQLLGIKPKYTAAELREPFIVPRVEYVPDISDPNVKELLKARVDVTQNALYGGQASRSNTIESVVGDHIRVLPAAEEYEPEPQAEEEAVEAEVVVEVEEAFDDFDDFEESADTSLDPGAYVIAEENSKFKGLSLDDAERAKPGYCRWIVKRGMGSVEMQAACENYVNHKYVDGVSPWAQRGGE